MFERIQLFYKKYKESMKWLIFVLKILLSCLLFYYLYTRIDLHKIMILMLDLPIRIIFLLLITTIIKFFSQVWNWSLVLKIDPQFNESWSKVIKTHFIGLYLKLIIPGGYGTFGKIAFINQHQKKATFLSILIEKFFQNWISLFFGVLSLLFIATKYKILWMILLIIISISPFLVPLVFKKQGNNLLWKCYNQKIPYLMISQYIHQIFTFFQYWLLFETLSRTHWFVVCKGVSIALLSTILPVSYSGLGVRETAFVYTFKSYGVSAEIAVAVSLIIFFYNSIIPAFPGLYYFLMINKKGK